MAKYRQSDSRPDRRSEEATREFPPGVKLLCTLGGHTGVLSNLAFDPTGQTLASVSFDGTVKLWEAGCAVQVSENQSSHASGTPTSICFE